MAYLAPALVQLRNEINAAHPGRDKSSDGWIGDASHAARKSDHNPDPVVTGVVRATDTDKDGPNMARILEIARKDDRVEYIIWEGHIYLRSTGFRKQVYTGTNGHFGHMHISLRHGKTYENSTRAWGYAAIPPSPAQGGSGVGPGGRAPDGTPWGSGKPIDVVAREVINGEWGSGLDRETRLRAALYDPALVQNTVNAILRGTPLPQAPAPKPPARKSVSQIADEVLAGAWGNNPQRGQRLAAAGYSPAEVQAEVNRRTGGGGTTRPSLTAIARQVINNQWGKGDERKRRLAAAGYDYNAVQAEVNRLLK